MYDKKELDIIKMLINKEIKEQYFNLGIAETELSFSLNNIKENGEGHKPFKTNLTVGEFKEITEDKIVEIKNKLENLTSLCFKTNEILEKIKDSENTLEADDWELEP